MSNTRIEIDPEGDTLIILPLKPSPAQSETPDFPTEKQYLCFKKHLTLASRRAAVIFSSQFKEASTEPDGLHHWRFEGIFDDEAFELILKIIHGKTRGIPRSVSLDLLAGIATIVDDLECHVCEARDSVRAVYQLPNTLECHETLSFFSEGWLLGYPNTSTHCPIRGKALSQLILASFVFEDAKLFESYTRTAIKYSDEALPTFKLPIREDIISGIESSRASILQHLIDGLERLQNRVLDQKLGCNLGCRSMLLGNLMQGMKASGVYPRPPLPYSSLSVDKVLQSLRTLRLPSYFGPENECPAGKIAGQWTYSTTLNQSSAKPPGLFDFAAQSQPSTPSKGTSQTGTGSPFPRNASFGTPQSGNTPFRPNVSSTTPSYPEGLLPEAVKTQDQEQPKVLVRHDCSLKDHVQHLISVAEQEIKGLQLANFPRP